jgi:hypothetical protein
MTPIFWGFIGYAFGRAEHGKLLGHMLMKNNDYFPLEVKRTLQDKDFRHMVDFNYLNPSRPLFD